MSPVIAGHRSYARARTRANEYLTCDDLRCGSALPSACLGPWIWLYGAARERITGDGIRGCRPTSSHRRRTVA
jgi:hypothetical protein